MTGSQRRRRRGSGGVVQARPGVWRVDVEISRDPLTGARRRISRQVKGTRADAEATLARLRVAETEGRLLLPGTRARTVRAALDAYLAEVEAGVIELAPKTVVTSRSARTTMCGLELVDGRRFGDIQLSSLCWQDVEQMFRVMRIGRSVEWVRRSGTVLSRALDRARKHGLIEHNPAKDAARPKAVRRKPVSPQPCDVRALIEKVAVIDEEMSDAVILLAGTGMRLGELLGLRWEDVHFAKGTVHVAHAVTDGGPGVGDIRKPTKRSDWRDVPLTATVQCALERQRSRWDSRVGSRRGPGSYVFPGQLGPDMPYRPDTFGARFARARGDFTITFLQLRHFAATTMLDAGEDYRTVADILGNSETTLRLHYDGRTNVDKRRAITALEL
jgi:integrase